MSDVTHAKCPACGSFQPVKWNDVKQVGMTNAGAVGYEFNGMEAVCRRCDFSIATLFDAIAHGDEKHRAWLKQAIKDHFAGKPVQPVQPPT